MLQNIISQIVQKAMLYIALYIAYTNYTNFKSPLLPPDLMVNNLTVHLKIKGITDTFKYLCQCYFGVNSTYP